ncbi:MAG: CHRD domain-containing protein [Balneolaceae bacterium]|nr:CHRD domain-containing protein [Balneolaceae bacterium]
MNADKPTTAMNGISKLPLLICLCLSVALMPNETMAQEHSGVILLAGYKQPEPVATAATGTVKFVIENDTLQISGEFADLTSPFRGAGIHFGEKGEEGNRLFRLTAKLNDEKTAGRFPPAQNRFKLNEAQKEYLLDGLFYINIYTAEHNHGEIRGQFPAKS